MTRHWSFANGLVMTLVAVATLLRFVDVTKSPPGFYIDEAAISAQVICVQESSRNLQGQAHPIFTEVLGGGYATPTYLYPAAAWISVFGPSIASFRSLTAFFSLLFIVGSFLFGLRFWRTIEAAWLCALSAAISPWAFQFARIAWDPSFAPAYTVWAFALLWAKGKYRNLELALSGLLFSLAAYTYPPLRVELALMLPIALVGLVAVYRRDWRPYLLTVAVAIVASLPLLNLTLSGTIQGRFQVLSVFNHDYLTQSYGSDSFVNGLKAMMTNFVMLLSPGYLIAHGDANLRHSTGEFGVWSWLDTFAIGGAIIGLVVARLGRTKPFVQTTRAKELTGRFEILFICLGYVAGILPAAMTWESNPHALRSLGAIVFLVLGTGGSLAWLCTCSKSLRSTVVGVAFLSFLMFARVYFNEYPSVARPWFDAPVTELAKNLSASGHTRELGETLKANGVSYAPMAVDYYMLADGSVRCPVKTEPETGSH